MRSADPIDPFRRHLKSPFLAPQITTFQAVIFSHQMPFLLSDQLSWTQGLRLSMGNEEKDLWGNQGKEMKKRKLASRNCLSYKIRWLSIVGHCTYNCSPQAKSRINDYWWTCAEKGKITPAPADQYHWLGFACLVVSNAFLGLHLFPWQKW
jgi:hypothetical protein